MSTSARTLAISVMRLRVARIQPTRSPPHAALLIVPIVITVAPGSNAATGGGSAGPSNRSSAHVSSATNSVPERAQATAIADRAAAVMTSPVGLWKSATLIAIGGATAVSVAAYASGSQPVGVSGTGTGRARAAPIAESVRG